MQMLTHTVAIIYSRHEWENSICKVRAAVCRYDMTCHFGGSDSVIRFSFAYVVRAFSHRQDRGFRVGLAIEFHNYVVSFNTKELLFCVR